MTASISGLLLQGCTMEGGYLSEAGSTAPELVRAPEFSLAWVKADAPEPYRPQEVIALPLYLSPARTKVTTELKVPFTGDRTQWVLCAAAFVLRDE